MGSQRVGHHGGGRAEGEQESEGREGRVKVRKGTPLASRVAQGVSGPSSSCVWNPRVFADDAPAACSFPGENARSWEALGEARPGQSSLSAGAVRLRNLYAGQEARVRTGHGTTDWFQIGKGVRQSCILSPCLFNFYAEQIY